MNAVRQPFWCFQAPFIEACDHSLGLHNLDSWKWFQLSSLFTSFFGSNVTHSYHRTSGRLQTSTSCSGRDLNILGIGSTAKWFLCLSVQCTVHFKTMHHVPCFLSREQNILNKRHHCRFAGWDTTLYSHSFGYRESWSRHKTRQYWNVTYKLLI